MPAPKKYPDELRERATLAVEARRDPVSAVARSGGSPTSSGFIRKRCARG